MTNAKGLSGDASATWRRRPSHRLFTLWLLRVHLARVTVRKAAFAVSCRWLGRRSFSSCRPVLLPRGGPADEADHRCGPYGFLLIGIVVVGAAQSVGWRGGSARLASPEAPSASSSSWNPSTSADLTTVKGVVGSEKKAFFADPEVKRVFAASGLDVEVRHRRFSGDRDIHRP
jgi:hypothetical protein